MRLPPSCPHIVPVVTIGYTLVTPVDYTIVVTIEYTLVTPAEYPQVVLFVNYTLAYLIFVKDTTDGVCVKKIARCKFLQI